jgi:hypothetical protein
MGVWPELRLRKQNKKTEKKKKKKKKAEKNGDFCPPADVSARSDQPINSRQMKRVRKRGYFRTEDGSMVAAAQKAQLRASIPQIRKLNEILEQDEVLKCTFFSMESKIYFSFFCVFN